MKRYIKMSEFLGVSLEISLDMGTAEVKKLKSVCFAFCNTV